MSKKSKGTGSSLHSRPGSREGGAGSKSNAGGGGTRTAIQMKTMKDAQQEPKKDAGFFMIGMGAYLLFVLVVIIIVVLITQSEERKVSEGTSTPDSATSQTQGSTSTVSPTTQTTNEPPPPPEDIWLIQIEPRSRDNALILEHNEGHPEWPNLDKIALHFTLSILNGADQKTQFNRMWESDCQAAFDWTPNPSESEGARLYDDTQSLLKIVNYNRGATIDFRIPQNPELGLRYGFNFTWSTGEGPEPNWAGNSSLNLSLKEPNDVKAKYSNDKEIYWHRGFKVKSYSCIDPAKCPQTSKS